MRRALRQSLPAFSLHFGIQPWQIDDLTYGEIDVYVEAINKIAEGAGRGRS